jgi:hypothetical protein
MHPGMDLTGDAGYGSAPSNPDGLAKSHLLSDVNLQLREAESDADANVCRAVGTKMKFSSALFFRFFCLGQECIARQPGLTYKNIFVGCTLEHLRKPGSRIIGKPRSRYS